MYCGRLWLCKMYHELRKLGKNTVLVFHAAVSKILIKMGSEHELWIWAHGFRGIWAPVLWTWTGSELMVSKVSGPQCCGPAVRQGIVTRRSEWRTHAHLLISGKERDWLDMCPTLPPPGFPWDAKSIQLAHCWPSCLFTWEDSLVRPPSLKLPKPTWVLNFRSLCNTRLPTAKGRASVTP